MVNLLGEHLEKATSYARQNPLGKSITMEKPDQKLAEKWYVTITTPCLSETLKEIETVGI